MRHLFRIFSFVFFLCSTSQANIVGTDLSNFNPTTNGLDFITVHSSDTLESGELNIGAFIFYSTNSLPYFTLTNAPTNQKFTEPNDNILANDFHLGLGLTKGWDIGVAMTNIIDQNIDNSAFLGTFAETGLADMRFNTKIRFYKGESSGAALIISADKERVANNPYSGLDPGLTYNGELAFDTMLSDSWRWAINGGYRFRDSGRAVAGSGITPMSDQVIYSSALSYLMSGLSSQLIFEIFGSSPTENNDTPTDRELSNLQGVVGWKWNARENLNFHIGGGTEIYHGLATPDILLFAGFNWRPGRLWSSEKDSDNDGVPDGDDRCPNTPPAFRDQVNQYGCADSDQDGVYNDTDQCPNTPPEERSTVNEVGCSNNDLDGDGVPNDLDRCPNTPPGTEVNDLGCKIDRVTDIKLQNLNFYTGTAKLVKKSRPILQDAINKIEAMGDTVQMIVVEGHTDSTGGADMNKALSQKRASAVRKALLKSLSLGEDKIDAVGYGEEKPIATNKTKAGRLQNRRVELRVIKKE